LFLGGHFAPATTGHLELATGGQFASAMGGQFTLKVGGHFHRYFHIHSPNTIFPPTASMTLSLACPYFRLQDFWYYCFPV